MHSRVSFSGHRQPTSWEQQRSEIRSIVVRFSEAVTIGADDITLTNLGLDPDGDPDIEFPLTDDHLRLEEDGTRLVLTFAGNGVRAVYGVSNNHIAAPTVATMPPSTATSGPMPSLEALDRVNRVTLAVGFPLITLGVLTGALWLDARLGSYFTGTLHETWMLIGWTIYLGLVVLRFGGRQGGRQAAASAVAGFAFLVVAVVGAGVAS